MSDTEQDFDLQILKEKEGASRYRVNVIQSPAGEADGEFQLPFSESEFNEMFRGLGQVRKATRGAASPEVAKAREFGSQLFDRVFSGDVRDCLNRSRGRTQAIGHGLRIRLRLTKVPELLDLPWELFFDRRHNRFVALDDGMTLVRHLPVAEPVIPMHVDAPLHVLVAISNPFGDLDTEQEWTKLSDALASLSEQGLVEVERLQPATFDGLQAKLRKDIFHVLHFVGHGEYDVATQSGFLSFEVKPKGEKRVGATRLADLLRPLRRLRLVVLNTCEGGRTSREDAFAGVAQSLVQSAIPAVVAMQFPVTDAAAIVFAGAFYAGIAEGRPVDLALAGARREVNLKGEEGDIEWATPVLYMRGSGALFDVGAVAGLTPAKQLPTPPPKALPTALLDTHAKSPPQPTNEPVTELTTPARVAETSLEKAALPISPIPTNLSAAMGEHLGVPTEARPSEESFFGVRESSRALIVRRVALGAVLGLVVGLLYPGLVSLFTRVSKDTFLYSGVTLCVAGAIASAIAGDSRRGRFRSAASAAAALVMSGTLHALSFLGSEVLLTAIVLFFGGVPVAAIVGALKFWEGSGNSALSQEEDQDHVPIPSRPANAGERILYSSAGRDVGYDFQGIEAQIWKFIGGVDQPITPIGRGTLTFERGGLLNIHRTNTEGRFEVWLRRYVLDGVEMTSIPRNELIPGERGIRVSCEAKVAGAEHVLEFVLKDEETNKWLGHEERRVTSNSWLAINIYFRIPPTQECRLRIDDRNVAAAPSSVQIRNVVVAEKMF